MGSVVKIRHTQVNYAPSFKEFRSEISNICKVAISNTPSISESSALEQATAVDLGCVVVPHNIWTANGLSGSCRPSNFFISYGDCATQIKVIEKPVQKILEKVQTTQANTFIHMQSTDGQALCGYGETTAQIIGGVTCPHCKLEMFSRRIIGANTQQ